jgi:hypothetical protein
MDHCLAMTLKGLPVSVFTFTKHKITTMKKSFFLVALLAFSLFSFNACKKEGMDMVDIVTSEDLATNEDLSEQIDIDADVAIEERGGGSTCPTVTTTQPWGTWPNTITVDYGADGCTRPDGRVLKGKLIIYQTDEIRNAGAVRTINHENFFVDDVQVEGEKTWTNNGIDANGFFSYTKNATDMKLTFNDGTSTTWTKTRTSTLIEGGNTVIHLDNVWSSTGSASGVNRNGVQFTATIVEPLIKKATCRWISKGIINLTRNDRTGTLDFGDGDCDRFANYTNVDDDTYIIRLRR